jgi:aminoglycoside phosphotransferase (APT) family kinase protein
VTQKAPAPDHDDLIGWLRHIGLVAADEAVSIRPLTGGVSSDIHLIDAGGRRFCVKRALSRLKVAAEWEAPVARNAAEAAWMRVAGAWMPGIAPAVLAEDMAAGLFAMSYLPPESHPVWKAELMAGRIDPGFAGLVGRSLAEIHARSAGDTGLALAFANHATFDQIRLDPYLRATGRAHPALQGRFERLASETAATRLALVHGDVSPKNILVGPLGPVFLDAECATYGDPAFDLAFCLNHLLLKGARRGAARDGYLEAFEALAQAYLGAVSWEAPEALELRAAALLPALFLARIDGKSPVEYLVHDDEREAVRRCAMPLVAEPPLGLAAIVEAWRQSP